MKRLLAALVAAILCAQAAIADTLVDNVNGYTLDKNSSLIRFTGLVIDDDGKVKQLLAAKDKRPERPSYKLDGRGRTLIPGLIDAHGHVMQLGYRAMQLDLGDTVSLEEALARIRAYAAANPTPRWIVGSGWNQEKWGLGGFPTAVDLDSAVGDRPVWIERIDGHAGWANSVAMREAGVDAASTAPPGGRIESTGKQPSGIFVDTAMDLVRAIVPSPLPLVQDRAFVQAQEKLLERGLTTVADMGTRTQDWLVLRRAADRGALAIRIIAYADGVDTALAVAGTGPTPWLHGGRLRMIGVRLDADGALSTRGAWLKADYRDLPGARGLPAQGDAKLKNLMSRGAMDQFQVAVKATGDAANARLLDAIEELAATYSGDRRWRIEQARIVDPADLPRFARHGIVASMQPTQVQSEWKMAEARIGRDRLGGSQAWASMLANKVPLALGSDFPVEEPNVFAGLAAAMSRQDAGGQPEGGWMPEQRLSLAQAFAGYTIGAAFASFEEDRLGSLERGRMADFLFIDRDIFANADNPQLIRGTRVLETWIGGRKVWERK